MNIVYVGEDFCNFRLFTYRKLATINYCAVCNKKLEEGDRVYLLLNNYKLFPNVLIHRNCCENMKEVATNLYKKYNKLRKLIIKTTLQGKAWFANILEEIK